MDGKLILSLPDELHGDIRRFDTGHENLVWSCCFCWTKLPITRNRGLIQADASIHVTWDGFMLGINIRRT